LEVFDNMSDNSKQGKLFDTKEMDVEREVITAGDIETLKLVVEKYDELRVNPKGEYGEFYTLECTTHKGPTALNISSKRLYRGLESCLEELRGKPVILTASGDGFSRHYELEFD
jgi:hypothetical protein